MFPPSLKAPFTLLGGFRLKKEGCVTQTNGAGCEKDDQDQNGGQFVRELYFQKI